MKFKPRFYEKGLIASLWTILFTFFFGYALIFYSVLALYLIFEMRRYRE